MQNQTVKSSPTPVTGFYRLRNIIGDPKASPPIPAIIPVGRSAWWAGVASGRYPKAIKLGPQTTVWTIASIQEFIDRASA